MLIGALVMLIVQMILVPHCEVNECKTKVWLFFMLWFSDFLVDDENTNKWLLFSLC